MQNLVCNILRNLPSKQPLHFFLKVRVMEINKSPYFNEPNTRVLRSKRQVGNVGDPKPKNLETASFKKSEPKKRNASTSKKLPLASKKDAAKIPCVKEIVKTENPSEVNEASSTDIITSNIKKGPSVSPQKRKAKAGSSAVKKIKEEASHSTDIEDTSNIKKEPSVSPQKRKAKAASSAVRKIKEEASHSTDIEDTSNIKKEPSVSPQKRKAKAASSAVKKIKEEASHSTDIEDITWEPENWRKVLDNILKMRKLHVAPVDSLGCEECPEKGVEPEVFRYQTLISVMLSSQTRDEVTFAATQRLIEHGLTVDSILRTTDEKIGELIYPAGFWKSKVKFIKNTSQIVKDQYNGDIPRTFKELCKLPGVGPKMANIVMSVAWKDTVGIAVDTHVHRISNRLGWVPKPTKDPEHTRKALESWLPKEEWRPINLTLVGFGQTICKPIGPSCKTCLNSEICPFGRSVLQGKNKKKPHK